MRSDIIIIWILYKGEEGFLNFYDMSYVIIANWEEKYNAKIM